MTTENPLARVALDYDPRRARPNTWCLSGEVAGVWIRFYEAASVEWTGDLRVRYRKHQRNAVFIRPIDADLSMWLSEAVRVEPDRVPVEFVFGGAPDAVARGLFLEV